MPDHDDTPAPTSETATPAATPAEASASSADPLDLTRTRLSGRWLRKMGLFLLLLIGFGIWGLYDALVAYPDRGENAASYRLYQYLEAADEAHGFALPLGVPEGVTPPEHRRDIRSRFDDLRRTIKNAGAGARDAQAELAMLAWLDSLSTLGRLKPERVDSDLSAEPPRDLLASLRAEWDAKDAPKPLSSYDIPVQWLFAAVGLGGGLWLGLHMVGVARKCYGWERPTMTLTLPDGSTLTPDQVAEFDKRKWDKFLFFFKIKPDHPSLGGRELKLDLYQYVPLEEWTVAMHKHARPEDYEDEGADQGELPDSAETAEPDAQSDPGEPKDA